MGSGNHGLNHKSDLRRRDRSERLMLATWWQVTRTSRAPHLATEPSALLASVWTTQPHQYHDRQYVFQNVPISPSKTDTQ